MVYLLAAAIISIDLITKIIVRTGMGTNDDFVVIKGLLSITHVENRGAAFGMMEGQSVILLIIPIVAVLVCMILAANKKYDFPVKIALSMIAAGGAGNLIDRLTRGTVTDMIKVSFFPPVFNVADIAVTLGAFLLMFLILRDAISGKG